MATTSENAQPADQNATADGAQHSQDRRNSEDEREHTPTPPTLPEDVDTDAGAPVVTPPSKRRPAKPKRKTRSQHARGAGLAKLGSARCNECIARGPTSRCDWVWPSCGQCVAHDTTGGCFQAAKDREAAIEKHYAAHNEGLRRRGLHDAQRPSPSPDPASPPPSPSPSARPIFSPAPDTIRSHRSHVTITSGSGSRIPRSSPQSISSRVSTPSSGRGVGRHKARADDIAAAREDLARAQAIVDALETEPSVPTPPLFQGLNVGQLGGSQSQRAPLAIGVIAQAEFSFVAQNIIDLFVKKNRTTHISFVYLTDAYNKQSSLHLTTTTYKTQVDVATGESILVAQPLPDLNERGMSFTDWSRAFQRFEAILIAIENPIAPRWAMHGHFIRHHPIITTNWPLALAYDIRVRRRLVTDHALDMGIFQPLIWESCRAEQQEEHFQDLRRAFAAAQPAPKVPTMSSFRTINPQIPTPSPLGLAIPLPRPNQNPRRGISRCFVCGTAGHLPKSCSGTPKLINKNADGKWVLKGHTPAPSAEQMDMAPRRADADPRIIVTPLRADAWEQLLAEAGVLSEFSDLPIGLRTGFALGVSPTPLLSITIHPNHKSATDRPEVISKYISKETEAGRYSGPFSPSELHSLIGNFRASPLGAVDKSSSPGDFRVIQDFSFPHDMPDVPSVNSEINVDDFPCIWGTFPEVAKTILSLPTGSQAATFDVDAAYRRMPVRTADQTHTVVHWDGKCWVDHCVPFGAASSCGIFGRAGDGLLHICTARGLGPVLKWVDDFLFFRSPRPKTFPFTFTYSEQQIYELGETLGIPWKIAKTVLFATFFHYIGFVWDIPSRRVSIPQDKKLKFIAKLQAWLTSNKVTLKATESVLGSLIHCALAMPLGRSRVVGIASFTASFSHCHKDKFITKVPSGRARQDVTWWLEEFIHGDCGSTLRAPPPKSDVKCYMDASTSFGIGIMINAEHGMWRLRKGWNSANRDIGWAEIIAIELTLESLLLKGFKDASIVLFSDNQGVIGALQAGRSRNDEQNRVLQRIIARALEHNLWLDIRYINTHQNPADSPSRGIPPPSSSKLTHFPSLTESAAKWLAWV